MSRTCPQRPQKPPYQKEAQIRAVKTEPTKSKGTTAQMSLADQLKATPPQEFWTAFNELDEEARTAVVDHMPDF